MIILDTTTRSLEILLGGSVSTNQLPVVTSFVDITASTFTPAAYQTITNNASAVTAVASPASGTQRQIKQLTVQNADTAATGVTARFNDNGITRTLVNVTLAVNETLQYNDGEGWNILAVTSSTSSGGGGSVTSGSVQGFFGPNRNIASGTVGVSDFGSGAVVAGSVGSGAIVSGNLASGNVARFHLASGAVNSGQVGSGSILGQAGGGAFTIASGTITTNDLGSGAVVSGLVASGQLGRFHIASGQLAGFELGSGAVVSGRIASGQIGPYHLASGISTSGGTLAYFTPLDNQPLASNYAVLGSRNNHTTLEFDNTTNWDAVFEGAMNRIYTQNGLSAVLLWASASGNTSGQVGWKGAFERLNANNHNLDTDAFATAIAQANTADSANSTNGKLTQTTISFTNSQIDGVVGGDPFRLKVTRDVTVSGNLANRAQLISVELC